MLGAETMLADAAMGAVFREVEVLAGGATGFMLTLTGRGLLAVVVTDMLVSCG